VKPSFFLSVRKAALIFLTLIAPFIAPLIAPLAVLPAQDLNIGAADLRVTQEGDSGFHLYIRKKAAVGSVLLSESVRDPALREDNYAYRALSWNPVNGDERRIVDGAEIPRESGIWSLIDSTPEPHAEFGQAFHIYIPPVLYYGYAWTRNGEIAVGNGTYFNLRSFALPYADYRGAFRDNSFLLEITQPPPRSAAAATFSRETEDSFQEIARLNKGETLRSSGPNALISTLNNLLTKERGSTLDLVIALDTTASMRDSIQAIKDDLVDALKENRDIFPSMRVGMVLYKDYDDAYVTKVIPFTNDLVKFQRTLMSITTGGGRDFPEAVYEALYDTATKFRWAGESRLVVLIGDAPPHPRPRGRITKEAVIRALNAHSVKVSAIILPQ
jgi:Mg-chelatase subunit ChlD